MRGTTRLGAAGFTLAVQITFSLVATSLVARPAEAESLPLTFVECEQTINDSIRVANSLHCPGNGITVGQPGITIELGGHRIEGEGLAETFGIDVSEVNGVTIRNGVITNFGDGIRLRGQRNLVEAMIVTENTNDGISVDRNRNTVRRNTIVANGDDGISLSANGNAIAGNTLARNDDDGIAVTFVARENVINNNTTVANVSDGIRVTGAPPEISFSPERNTFASNRASGNGGAGIVLSRTTQNVVDGNTIAANVRSGIVLVDEADGNTITGNRITGNDEHGMFVQESDSNTISANRSTGNHFRGIHLETSAGNRILGNTASANNNEGIGVFGATAGNRINGNKTHENGGNGIFSDSATGVLNNNIAFRNGFLDGIDDDSAFGFNFPALVPAQGNKAGGNENGAECEPTTLCSTIPPPQTDPPTTFVQCDTDIFTSIRVANNLRDCAENQALAIRAPNVIVNLGGHRIDGVTNERGIVAPNQSGVTVRNGVVTDWGLAVSILGDRATVERVTAVRNGVGIDVGNDADISVADNVLARNLHGVELGEFASGNLVTGSTFLGNGSSGVHRLPPTNGASPGGPNVIKSNAFIGAEADGIQFQGSGGDRVRDNRLIGNGAAGIILDGSDNNVVKRNTVVASGNNGIAVAAATGNKLVANVVRGSDNSAIFLGLSGTFLGQATNNVVDGNQVVGSIGNGVILFSPDNEIKNNVARANSTRGIGVFAASNTLIGNATNENGFDGIAAFSLQDSISANRAIRNGFLGGEADGDGLGIEAPNNQPGDDNVALKNDDPLECVPSSLC